MKKEVATVRVPDLEKEFGLPGRTIRQALREAGVRAPETGIEGFGPRARYEWTEGSEELQQVRSILQEFVASKSNARQARTKQEEVESEEAEELEQEEEEEEEEEEDSEDDEDDEDDDEDEDDEDDEDED